MHHIECGVVLRQIGIAAVTENAFDEIQIAHQTAGSEEPDFHRFGRLRSSRGTDQRTQQQGDEEPHLLFLIRRERQRQDFRRKAEARGQQRGKGLFGTAILSAGIGNPPSTI